MLQTTNSTNTFSLKHGGSHSTLLSCTIICEKSTIFGELFSLSLTLNHADSIALSC